MFPIKTIDVNPYDKDGYFHRDAAQNEAYTVVKNLSRIGSGIYAEAYSSDLTPFVVKIGNLGDLGYISYLEIIAELGIENPYLPRIIDLTFYKQEGADFEYLHYYVVRIEKLVKGEFQSPWSNSGGTFFEHQCRFVRTVAKGELPPWPIDPVLEEAITVVQLAYERANSKNISNYDLHCENFMLRGEQLVITDPIS